MNRNELLKLFGDEPILGKRVALSPLTSDKVDLLLNHMLGTLNVPEDIKQLMKKECEDALKDKYHIVFLIYSEANDFIGYTEFKNLDGTPEIGIDLAEKYQGKGYGFETCQILVNKLFEKTDYDYIAYNAFKYNKASIALAKKLGASYIGCKGTFDMLKKSEVSNETKAEAEQFDKMLYRIYR